MLKLKEVKPMFSQVLVTENLYGWDDKDEYGVITATKGDINYILKDYEEVAYNDKDELTPVEKPKVNLILPNKKIYV